VIPLVMGLPLRRFRKVAAQKFSVMQALIDPERYDFGVSLG